jgi:PPOX class probable F420-dependent enzyme
LHQQNKGQAALWTRRLLKESRVGHLATCNVSRKPHVVPLCYVYHDDALYSSIDKKPKRSKILDLRRIINIETNPNVCVVIDHYEENWNKLRFIMVHGKAELLWSGEEHQRAINLLRKKYPQYRSMNLQTRPIIKILPRRISTWSADSKLIQAESE